MKGYRIWGIFLHYGVQKWVASNNCKNEEGSDLGCLLLFRVQGSGFRVQGSGFRV